MTTRGAVAAELIGAACQHFLMVADGHPEKSWFNRASDWLKRERESFRLRRWAEALPEEPPAPPIRLPKRTKGRVEPQEPL